MLSSVNPVDYSPLTCLTTSADISVWHSGCLSSSSHPDVCEIYGLRLLLSQSPSDTNTPLFLSLFTAHKHIQMQTTTFHQSLTGTDIKPLINFSSTLSSPTYMVSNRGLSLPVSLFLFLSHAANTWWQSWWNINVFSEVLLFGELPWPWVFFHPSLSLSLLWTVEEAKQSFSVSGRAPQGSAQDNLKACPLCFSLSCCLLHVNDSWVQCLAYQESFPVSQEGVRYRIPCIAWSGGGRSVQWFHSFSFHVSAL